MRDHAGSAVGLTHAEIVKSCNPLTMLLGSWTNSPVPHRFSAVPISPGTRGPVALHAGLVALSVTGPFAHRLFRIAFLMLLAIVVISAAFAVLPRKVYSCAAVCASAYQYELSV